MRVNLLLALVITTLTARVPAQIQGTCGNSVLPPQVQALLENKFPEWRVKATSDLEGYDKELQIKEHPKECPGLAIGHFEDSSQFAYGLLLVRKSAATTGYKLVVLVKSGAGDNYLVRMLDEDQGSDSGLVISKVAPGRITGFDTTQSVRLRLDGLEAEWLEKSSVLYYWRNGKYQTLETSD